MYIYLYLNSLTRPEAFNSQCWSKIVKIRPKLLEIRSLLVGRPQTLEIGSNERSLRSNFVQNCSKFQQNVVQLAQNVAKFDVAGPIFVLFRDCSACVTRLAAQRAEPLFLLAGAVLSRVRRLCRQIQNPPKLTKSIILTRRFILHPNVHFLGTHCEHLKTSKSTHFLKFHSK